MMAKKREYLDFHAHILPAADHGSKTPEMCRAQLDIYKRLGVTRVVATPHFYPQQDTVESFLEGRRAAAWELSQLLEEGHPKVYLGAEVLVCPGIDHMPSLRSLCIEGTDTILLEMPFSSWREEHIDAVRRISKMGLRVVMAHIDRYPIKSIARLADECDVLYQLNGDALFASSGKRRCNEILRSLPVCAAGSDLHGEDKAAVKRFMKLDKYLDKYLDKKARDYEYLQRGLMSGATEVKK